MLVLQGIYVLELFLKIIGMGLVLGRNTYLRDGWNIIDFIVIILG
jgi:hypothetical protein